MPADSVQEVFLNPGDFHFAGGHTRIRTLLGSCVSIALWHPERKLGGMCHFILPERGQPAAGQELDGRYATEAMGLFDRAIGRAGTRLQDYRAKIFGGGNMFPGRENHAGIQIGQRNIEVAHRLLAERKIAVVAEHLGGAGHRKLVFDIWSGDAWLVFREAGTNKN